MPRRQPNHNHFPHTTLFFTTMLLLLLLHTVTTTTSIHPHPHPNRWQPPTPAERLLSPSLSCDFDIIHYPKQALTAAQFQRTYQHRRPVLFRNYSASFLKAQTTISQRQALMHSFGSLLVDVGRSYKIVEVAGHGDNQETLSSYMNRSRQHRQDKEFPYVFFDFQLRPNTTQVYQHAGAIVDELRTSLVLPLDDTFIDDEPSRSCDGSNAPGTCNALHRFIHYYLLVGTRHSAVDFHAHGDAWNLLVVGEKRWSVYPPGGLEAGASNYSNYQGHLHWLRHVLPKHVAHSKPFHCHQQAGDLLYLPEGNLHAVLNLGETVGLAMQTKRRTTVMDELSHELKHMHQHRPQHERASSLPQQMSNGLIAFHERIYPDPSQPQQDFLSMLYLDRSRMAYNHELYTDSIADAKKAIQLNENNIEGRLLEMLCKGKLNPALNWYVQLKRLNALYIQDKTLVLVTIAIARHFLEGFDTGQIGSHGGKQKEKTTATTLYLDVLSKLVNAVQMEEAAMRHFVYKHKSLKTLNVLSLLLEKISTMMQKHVAHRSRIAAEIEEAAGFPFAGDVEGIDRLVERW